MSYNRKVVSDEYHYEQVDETTVKYTPPTVQEIKYTAAPVEVKYCAPVSYFSRSSPSYRSFTLRPRSLSRSATFCDQRPQVVDIQVEDCTTTTTTAPTTTTTTTYTTSDSNGCRQPRQETRVCRYETRPKRSVSRSTVYDDGENVIDIKVVDLFFISF
jgi:hypothetical protein